jgi:hypothetical protein
MRSPAIPCSDISAPSSPLPCARQRSWLRRKLNANSGNSSQSSSAASARRARLSVYISPARNS